MNEPVPNPPEPSAELYEARALAELHAWEVRMTKAPGPWDRATRNMQDTVNRIIPEGVHKAVTARWSR